MATDQHKSQTQQRPPRASEQVWQQHLMWLEITGQEAQRNRQQRQSRCSCGRKQQY